MKRLHYHNAVILSDAERRSPRRRSRKPALSEVEGDLRSAFCEWVGDRKGQFPAYGNVSASRSARPRPSLSETIASSEPIGQGMARSGSFHTMVRSPDRKSVV